MSEDVERAFASYAAKGQTLRLNPSEANKPGRFNNAGGDSVFGVEAVKRHSAACRCDCAVAPGSKLSVLESP